MSKEIPHNALIVIADGHKAILFRNRGTSGRISLTEESRLTPKDLNNDGPSGSRPEEQTPRQTNEATFAKQLTERLYEMKQKGSFDDLVLVADPQTLGQLRNTMHKTVQSSIIRTLDKELTNHSEKDIAAALQ